MSINITEIESIIFTKKQRIENFLHDYEKIIQDLKQAVTNKDLEQLRITGRYLNLARLIGSPAFKGEIAYTLLPALQNGDFTKIEKFLTESLAELKLNLEEYLQSLITAPTSSTLPARPPYWGEEHGTPPNSLVYVIHGGGVQYILDWLKGKEEGYRLERPGKGIQVLPSLENSYFKVESGLTRFYATDRSAQSLDYPGYLFAEIEAQYLDSAGRGEAGVRTECRAYLKNITVDFFLPNFNLASDKSEFEKIPKEILFEVFKIKGSLTFLNVRERSLDIEPVQMTHFFNAFKNGKSYKHVETIVSIIQDYVPEQFGFVSR